MINLEIPRKFNQLISQAHQVAAEVLRPNSRKYDTLEHEYPKELDMLAAAVDGLNAGGALAGAGVGAVGANGSAPTRARTSRTPQRSLVSCAARRAWRSAPTACSCSAGTGS